MQHLPGDRQERGHLDVWPSLLVAIRFSFLSNLAAEVLWQPVLCLSNDLRFGALTPLFSLSLRPAGHVFTSG